MTQSHDQVPEPGQPQPAGNPEPVPPTQSYGAQPEPPAGQPAAQSYDQHPAGGQPQMGAYPESAGPVYQVPPTQAHHQQPQPSPYPEPGGYVYQVQPTHSYDQQPAQAPGQPYPGAYGYPVVPAPLPPAPMMYGSARRPGVITASAVLAYVQAGITGIATLFMFVSLFASGFGTGRLLLQTAAVLAAAVGVGLLIAGGVRLMAGSNRTTLMVACVVEFVICLFYVIVFATMSDSELDPGNTAELDGTLGAARGVLVVFAIFFAIMPIISLSLSRGRAATDFLRSRGVR